MITVDRLMMEEYAVSLEQMMENAGRNLAELARRQLGGQVQDSRITVLCGPGNNGGGGMVAVRHLHNWGARLNAALASDPAHLGNVPAHQWAILSEMRLTEAAFDLESSDLILDALLGYGSRGDPRSPVKEWIERANASTRPILSLDSPSGLDTTTGVPGKSCIRAAATMTLAVPKTGLLAPGAREYVGDLWLADIGVPPDLYRRIGLGAVAPFIEAPIVRIS